MSVGQRRCRILEHLKLLYCIKVIELVVVENRWVVRLIKIIFYFISHVILFCIRISLGLRIGPFSLHLLRQLHFFQLNQKFHEKTKVFFIIDESFRDLVMPFSVDNVRSARPATQVRLDTLTPPLSLEVVLNLS